MRPDGSAKSAFVRRAMAELIAKTPVGNRLVTEQVLARDLGCARGTLRQALRSYIREGVLVRRRGAGTIVVRHPKTRPDDVVLELWTPAFARKDPRNWAMWNALVDHGPDVRLVQQSARRGDWLDDRQLACGAMRASAVPSLQMLEPTEIAEQVAARALADLTDSRKLLSDWQDIEDWAWSICSVNGAVYGVPYLVSAYGLWIANEALESARLARSPRPNNWNDLADALATVKRATGRRLAVTPPTDAVSLLGTLTALAGGPLQHQQESVPEPTDALRQAMKFYHELMHRRRVIDRAITFGRAPGESVRERTFGFFHGTLATDRHGEGPPLTEYTYWPIPPLNSSVVHSYPLMIYAWSVNRRLNQEQRLAALRYIDLATSNDNLRHRCQTEKQAFLSRRSQWDWPEAPPWLERVRAGWSWIMRQPLVAQSSPAGYSPRDIEDLYMRLLLGQKPF